MIFKSPMYMKEWIADPQHGDPDKPLFKPPVARRKKKKGRTKRSRHTSGGEMGRKNGRTKKPNKSAIPSGNDSM